MFTKTQVAPTIVVRLEGDKIDVLAFMQWLWDNSIYSIKGFTSCGPDFYYGVFDSDCKDAIENYLNVGAGQGSRAVVSDERLSCGHRLSVTMPILCDTCTDYWNERLQREEASETT